jgi:hypothetical protein
MTADEATEVIRAKRVSVGQSGPVGMSQLEFLEWKGLQEELSLTEAATEISRLQETYAADLAARFVGQGVPNDERIVA